MPRFSLVIPAYNASPYIGATLRSVLGQTFTDFEAIVVDDGSKDDTVEVARAAVGGDPRFRVISQANAGPGAARNAGTEAAAGEYIVFLDADDLLTPWALRTQAEAIDAAPGPAALLLAQASRFRGDPPEPGVGGYPAHTELKATNYRDVFEASDRALWFATTVMTCERRALLETGGFDGGNIYLEDLEVAIKVGSRPGFIVIESPRTVLYREHEMNRTKQRDLTYSGVIRMVRKERRGELPGGRGRARERRRYICRAGRAISYGQARAGRVRAVLHMWWATLWWQVRDGRIAYVLGLPLVLARGMVVRGNGRATK
ncbi:MAG: glycosyltransferase family 2 protein [Phycisphaeraceae bacterium]|nr:glycosyltransferase family 2 protein [Phycisphaeraceae bacterium]